MLTVHGGAGSTGPLHRRCGAGSTGLLHIHCGVRSTGLMHIYFLNSKRSSRKSRLLILLVFHVRKWHQSKVNWGCLCCMLVSFRKLFSGLSASEAKPLVSPWHWREMEEEGERGRDRRTETRQRDTYFSIKQTNATIHRSKNNSTEVYRTCSDILQIWPCLPSYYLF